MRLTPGEEWGAAEPVPSDVVWVSTDSEARELVVASRRSGSALPRLCLTGGDLARCLGGGEGADRVHKIGATHVQVDVGSVLLDGKLHWFIAHMVARNWWLTGRILIVANTDFLGRWNVAPRAHPGDGLLDFLDSDLSLGDRIKAKRRLPSGTHVPHPGIRYRRDAAFQISLARPTPIRLDGTRIGSASQISVRVESERLDVWI